MSSSSIQSRIMEKLNSNQYLSKLNSKQQLLLLVVISAITAFAAYKLFMITTRGKNNSNNKKFGAGAEKIICGSPDASSSNDYDVIVCGGSISGTATSIQFAKQGRRVLCIEKDLSRPDTIIGELLQPGGVQILKQMGLEQCALKVGVPAHGYAAMMDGEWVDLPFSEGADGVSFHHGDFVTELRRAMLTANDLPEVKKSGGRVTVIEGVADGFVFDSRDTNLVRGVSYRPRNQNATTDETAASSSSPAKNNKKKSAASNSSSTDEAQNNKVATPGTSHAVTGNQFSKERKTALAPLVVCCDGAYSVLRPDNPISSNPHSHFVGMILRHVNLKRETRGNVILGKKGIILSYRLDPNEVRFLIDYGVSGPLPPRPKLIQWLRNDMMEELPEHLKEPFEAELQRCENGATDAIRARPHYHFTPVFPKYKGMVGLGDHGNMRHPLTGAGMTCALRDAYKITEALKHIPDFTENRSKVQSQLRNFYTDRPSWTFVLNVLSWALYGVFTGPFAIRKAVMEYFNEGGDAVFIPLQMLAGLESRFPVLLWHYVSTMISGAKFLIAGKKGQRSIVKAVTFFINPLRLIQAVFFVCYATYLFGSVVWKEYVTPWRILDRPNSIFNF